MPEISSNFLFLFRYFVSLAYTGVFLLGAKILGLPSSLLDLCTPAFLRSINVVLSLLCYLLFVRIMRYLEPDKSLKQIFGKATLLAFYPLHWFFAFLYYTDVGSTTAVMAMHLACLQQAHWISALVRWGQFILEWRDRAEIDFWYNNGHLQDNTGGH